MDHGRAAGYSERTVARVLGTGFAQRGERSLGRLGSEELAAVDQNDRPRAARDDRCGRVVVA
jgi:hypothetical protein